MRAKRSLAEKQIPFEIPRGGELVARLASVLEVIYLTFNEGYSATQGDDWMRPQLCEEAMRLGRILCGLMPQESEVFGLTALMEIQASRIEARTGPGGEPILLLDQDRARGISFSSAADCRTRARRSVAPGARLLWTSGGDRRLPRAGQGSAADRLGADRIALRCAGSVRAGSPVVELNRAVAHAMVEGPQAGLDLVDALIGGETLKAYHLLPSVRADFLFKLGRLAEAEAEFRRAAGSDQNAREKSSAARARRGVPSNSNH